MAGVPTNPPPIPIPIPISRYFDPATGTTSLLGPKCLEPFFSPGPPNGLLWGPAYGPPSIESSVPTDPVTLPPLSSSVDALSCRPTLRAFRHRPENARPSSDPMRNRCVLTYLQAVRGIHAIAVEESHTRTCATVVLIDESELEQAMSGFVPFPVALHPVLDELRRDFFEFFGFVPLTKVLAHSEPTRVEPPPPPPFRTQTHSDPPLDNPTTDTRDTSSCPTASENKASSSSSPPPPPPPRRRTRSKTKKVDRGVVEARKASERRHHPRNLEAMLDKHCLHCDHEAKKYYRRAFVLRQDTKCLPNKSEFSFFQRLVQAGLFKRSRPTPVTASSIFVLLCEPENATHLWKGSPARSAIVSIRSAFLKHFVRLRSEEDGEEEVVFHTS